MVEETDHPHTHLLTVHRSLYCIFWNLVSALPAHSSTYPSTTWNTVLWMAWVKCICSWSIAVCRESQAHCYENHFCQDVTVICQWEKTNRRGKKIIGDAYCILDILDHLQTSYALWKWAILCPVSMEINETIWARKTWKNKIAATLVTCMVLYSGTAAVSSSGHFLKTIHYLNLNWWI